MKDTFTQGAPQVLTADRQLRFHEIVAEMSKLYDKKNIEYTGGVSNSPLGNFQHVSQIMRLYPGFDWTGPLGVAMCYMLKQLDAAFLMSAQKRESVVGEPIVSRLMDVAVYSVLGILLANEEHADAATKGGGLWSELK